MLYTKFKISDHAAERFRERFDHIKLPIDTLLQNSIYFGGQKGSDYLLINKEHEIVFPVSCDHIIKSVLTLQQAKSNLSLINKTILFELEKSKCEELRKNAEDEIVSKLKILAREYLSLRPEEHRNCPGVQETKCLIKKIKKKLSLPSAQIDKIFIGEIIRIVQESDWSCLSPGSKWASTEELLSNFKLDPKA